MTSITKIKKREVLIAGLLAFLVVSSAHIENISFLPNQITLWLALPIVQLILCLPIVFVLTRYLWLKSWLGLQKSQIFPETLIVLALVLSFGVSALAVVWPAFFTGMGVSTNLYFDISALIAAISLVIYTLIDWINRDVILPTKLTSIELETQAQSSWLSLVTVVGVIVSFFIWSGLFNLSLANFVLIDLAALLIVAPNMYKLAATNIINRQIDQLEKLDIKIIRRESFVRLSQTTDVILDKTVLVTQAQLKVTDLAAARPKTLLEMAAALEQGIDHPIAQAIEAKRLSSKFGLKEVKSRQIYPGLGIVGLVDGQKVVLGNMALMRQEGIVVGVLQREKTRLEQAGKTVIVLGLARKSDDFKPVPGELVGMIGLEGDLQGQAKDMINNLAQNKLNTWLLTGESQTTATAIGQKIGLMGDRIIGEILPKDKTGAIQKIRQAAKGQTAFLGTSETSQELYKLVDISLSLGEHQASDIVLNERLAGLADVWRLSRKCQKKIKQNRQMATIYNFIALPLALGLFNFQPVNLMIPPVLALVISSLATLLVVANSGSSSRKPSVVK